MLASEMLGGWPLRARSSDRADLQLFLPSPAAADDVTGNGGGFVFDARNLPIRDAKNASALTGKDAAVIEYLNQQESVHQFLANVLSLVDASVSSYQRRGFQNLMVSFGCTGGQHRSVYLAESLANACAG